MVGSKAGSLVDSPTEVTVAQLAGTGLLLYHSLCHHNSISRALYTGPIAEGLGFYNEAERAFRTPVKQKKLVAPIHLWLVLNGVVARDDGQYRWHAWIDAVLLELADSSK